MILLIEFLLSTLYILFLPRQPETRPLNIPGTVGRTLHKTGKICQTDYGQGRQRGIIKLDYFRYVIGAAGSRDKLARGIRGGDSGQENDKYFQGNRYTGNMHKRRPVADKYRGKPAVYDVVRCQDNERSRSFFNAGTTGRI